MKSTEIDEVVIRMSSTLNDFIFDKITLTVNGIYNRYDIPEGLTVYIFIALPRKPVQMNVSFILMSHITKDITRIVMNIVRRRMRSEIGHERCNFIKDTGTGNTIFIHRMISEKQYKCRMRDTYL